jgi:hypothetical protein
MTQMRRMRRVRRMIPEVIKSRRRILVTFGRSQGVGQQLLRVARRTAQKTQRTSFQAVILILILLTNPKNSILFADERTEKSIIRRHAPVTESACISALTAKMQNNRAQNPCRVPDGRWLRAQDWLNGGPVPTARRDGVESAKCIKRLERFLRAYRQCQSNEQLLCRLALEYPAIFWAHYLYNNESIQRARFAVEARIMARQSDREIAQCIGCLEATVAAYEAIFFHVRDKLDNKDYIISTIFRESVSRGLQDRDYDLLWKLVGYAQGPSMLDAMISGFASPTWVERTEDVAASFQDLAIDSTKHKAAVAALAVPVDNSTQMSLINTFVKYTNVERKTDSAGKASDQIQQNIDSMMEALPFGAGTRPKDHCQQNPAEAQFDKPAAELSTDELVNVVVGFRMPHLDERRPR